MSTNEALTGLLCAAAGAMAASGLAMIPALHIYNAAAFIILAVTGLGSPLPPHNLALLLLGMVTSYSVLNTIPSIFLSAPDDSMAFILLPAQKYLMHRRGYEAALLTAIGSLGGIGALVVLSPLAPHLFPVLRAIVQPHMHWIIWTFAAYMLMAEWPKGSGRAPAGLRRLWDGWKSLLAGLVTFLMSGVLGLILMYRPVLPVTSAFQSLMPVFVGLFAVPWLLQNLLAQVELPPQFIPCDLDLTPGQVLRGTFAGTFGGMLAAFLPLVTGGLGGYVAGHATAQRDERLFIISQGASKVVYYVGGFLLFFVPGLHLTRGGMAWMISTLWSPHGPHTYYLAVASAALSGTVGFFLLPSLARLMIRLTSRLGYRWISLGTLGLVLGVVFTIPALGELLGGESCRSAATAGAMALLVCTVATGIGLIPVLWGSRRMNCMGALLLPIGLNMVGAGAVVAQWLGLVR